MFNPTRGSISVPTTLLVSPEALEHQLGALGGWPPGEDKSAELGGADIDLDQ
jgi:hypothetical protein